MPQRGPSPTGKHNLIAIRWPCMTTNRMLLSIFGLWRGGKEPYTLKVADCVSARVEQIEAWTPAHDHKSEPAGRPPTLAATWVRQAENHTKMFGSACGLEHVAERMTCIHKLRELNEQDEATWSLPFVSDLFEELVGVWCEGVRKGRRRLCRQLGTDTPRPDDLKLIGLSPKADGSPNFTFPDVFDLESATGYFQTVVVPLMDRKLTRLLSQQLHSVEQKKPPRKTGGPKKGEEEETAAEDKLGGDKAYPAGRRISGAEATTSLQQAPRDPETKTVLCWDYSTHAGCQRGSECGTSTNPYLASASFTTPSSCK